MAGRLPTTLLVRLVGAVAAIWVIVLLLRSSAPDEIDRFGPVHIWVGIGVGVILMAGRERASVSFAVFVGSGLIVALELIQVFTATRTVQSSDVYEGVTGLVAAVAVFAFLQAIGGPTLARSGAVLALAAMAVALTWVGLRVPPALAEGCHTDDVVLAGADGSTFTGCVTGRAEVSNEGLVLVDGATWTSDELAGLGEEIEASGTVTIAVRFVASPQPSSRFPRPVLRLMEPGAVDPVALFHQRGPHLAATRLYPSLFSRTAMPNLADGQSHTLVMTASSNYQRTWFDGELVGQETYVEGLGSEQLSSLYLVAGGGTDQSGWAGFDGTIEAVFVSAGEVDPHTLLVPDS